MPSRTSSLGWQLTDWSKEGKVKRSEKGHQGSRQGFLYLLPSDWTGRGIRRSRKKRSRARGTRGRDEAQADPEAGDGEAVGDCAKSMETDSCSSSYRPRPDALSGCRGGRAGQALPVERELLSTQGNRAVWANPAPEENREHGEKST